MIAGKAIRHRRCGSYLTLAVLDHDVAVYLYCDRCADIVEVGELDVDIPPDKQDTWINLGMLRVVDSEDGDGTQARKAGRTSGHTEGQGELERDGGSGMEAPGRDQVHRENHVPAGDRGGGEEGGSK